MRKIPGTSGAILALVILVISGCATFKMAELEAVDQAALVSVYCDKRIDMSDFKGMATIISRLAQDKNFNLESSAVQMKDDVLQKYAPYLPFSFLDEITVTGNPGYQTLFQDKPKIMASLKSLVWSKPEGYQIITMSFGMSPGFKETLDKLFEAFPKSKALVFVFANFKLTKESSILGFGRAKVQATHSLLIIDRNKKIILNKTTNADSKSTIKFALGGVFDASKIQPLCVEALNRASAKTNTWILKKMTK